MVNLFIYSSNYTYRIIEDDILWNIQGDYICYRRHIPASVKERALAESVAQVHRRVPVHVLPTHVSVYTCHIIHVYLRGEVRPRLHQLPDQPLPQLRAAHPSSRALGHRVSWWYDVNIEMIFKKSHHYMWQLHGWLLDTPFQFKSFCQYWPSTCHSNICKGYTQTHTLTYTKNFFISYITFLFEGHKIS